MPGRDGTGPMGLGPMTGRGAGYCVGRGIAQGVTRGLGLGFRGGRGAGRGGYGRRNMFYATGLTGWQRAAMGQSAFGGAGPAADTTTKDQEVDMLKQQAELLEGQIGSIKQRIEELSKRGAVSE